MKDKLFRDILPRVAKPARYSGGEYNMIKKDWNLSRTCMVLAFPDVYEVGMSHLGSRILYGLVNEKSEHLVERTFAPWPDMESLMRAENIPLYSLESFRPLADFEVIGFSMQYELSISNVLNMLSLGQVPLWSGERRDEHPLIIAGGPVAFNPEPMAEFFDLFIIGDGEEVLLELLDAVEQTRGIQRSERLLRMAAIEGVYVPSLYQVTYNESGSVDRRIALHPPAPERIRKRVVKDLDQAYFPNQPLVPHLGIIHDRAVLEVMRGCQRGCRFCQAGMVYRPVRERSPGLLKDQARRQLHSTGYDELSLASLSTLDYSAVLSLVKDLVAENRAKGVGVALPSLRVDAFSVDLANEVQKVRKTTLTLAPEAGSQRLRDIINKNVSEEQLYEAVEAAFRSGWLSLKLYFMYGLPTETEEDLLAIPDILQKVQAIGNRLARRPVEIRASLACFVPKAHTPFQWQGQDSIEVLDEKRRLISKKRRKNIKISFHDSRVSFLEGVIARGDRRLARVIHRAWEKGCKFDGWSEYFNFERWMEAFAELGVAPESYTADRSYGDKLPWDFIDIGVSKEFLYEENEKALMGELSWDCRETGCNECGICPALGVALDIKGEESCV